MAETAVDFLLESLNRIRKGETDCPFSEVEMERIGCLCESLRTSLEELVKNRSEHKEIEDLVRQIRDVAYEAADIIDLSLVDHISKKKRSPIYFLSSCGAADIIDISFANKTSQKQRNLTQKISHRKLSDVLKEMKSLKKQVTEIFEHKLYPQAGLSFRGSSSRVSAPNVEEEIVVGFDHEVEMLRDRLTGTQEQLQVISIVGMAGLGKTTLARKLYNDSFILYHFYLRGWTSVSQVYRKRDVLLGILSSVFLDKDKIYVVSDEKLGEEVYKLLKGKRYLVVMDDMWDIGVWNDLRIYFPNDNNGSRILFTSRHTDVALHANNDSPPHSLHFLNEDESWDLLQRKIFWKESCPPEFTDIGKQIAKKCQGLPLAIVVVAGLLAKTDSNQDFWKQVAENLSSYMESGTEQCMDILALSYNNLPYHLKSCFLYFCAFPEDYEISVRKLIWLWIAEGFIIRIGDENRSVEDVAEDYLMDLIHRNLVLVAKRTSMGGIRACRVHDLLHDLCLRKAKEENFLQHIYGNTEVSSSSPITNKQLFLHTDSKFFNLLRHLFLKKATEENSLQQIHGYDQRPSSSSSLVHIGKQHRRLCVNSHAFYYIPSKPFAPHIRSFLCFVSEQTPLPPESISFIYPAFILLRVLDLSAISIISFPSEIVQLFLLRYLALQGKHLEIPTTIGNLRYLEMLIISQGAGSFIPKELWNIVTLRHLRIAGENFVDVGRTDTGYFALLSNLQTISHISPTSRCEVLLSMTPNLRKLGFCGCFRSYSDGSFFIPELDFLNHLETLKLLNWSAHRRYNLQFVKFPPNLKRLTLSNIALEWKEMSVLGMLPNLEVLKLEYQACIGSLWETSDGGFCQLKYLRLYYMNVEQWNSSSIHFPSLQHLVLHNCRKLEEIPSEFGDICTLHTIEVSCCSDSAVNSAREIQKEQEDMGNNSLMIIIINPLD